MARDRLVIVGNGMAGLRLLEEVVARTPDRFDITVVGAEPQPAYNRVLLSALIAGDVNEEECRFRERPWYRNSGARLIVGFPATLIDIEEQEVVVGDTTVLPYDACVLATGSQPVRPTMPGMNLAGVVTFRDLSDVAQIRNHARRGAKAVVIGGGLLGIEAAIGLTRAGASTTLVHIMDRLMERQLDQAAAAIVRRSLEDRGVGVELGAETIAIEGDARAEQVRLACGRSIAAELVVVSIGVRPNVILAQASGLVVNRGVVVDDGLMTSVPGISAVGECIEHRGLTYGLVEPGYDQAQVLARRLAGEAVTYAGSVVATHLKVSGLPVFSAGNVGGGPPSEEIVYTDFHAAIYRKLVVTEGFLTGAVLVGDTTDADWYLDLLRDRTPVARLRDDLPFGRPSLAQAA
jgi:nitrite reductase (NADH) large subunit